ncbi:hypothetical protein [Gordonia caeni]|uniref:hypothetical protein n=1 Tax=Gordonia caeni TaxID=1007097 RepID=UPI0031D01296
MSDRDPCPCWKHVTFHAGHCCMADDGHGNPTSDDDYRLGQPAPCGHGPGGAQ